MPPRGSKSGRSSNPNNNIEQQVDALYSLRATPDQALPAIEKAMQGRNNFVASKAAALAGELQFRQLIPLLAETFARFMTDPETSDPQCWAKVAVVKALKDLGHTEAAVFLRGARHVQMEPVWGGRVDTAGPLRAACLLALPGCQVDGLTVVTFLADALTDSDKNVRVEAALALAHTGMSAAVPVLRLKALSGDEDPEVIGQCLASILELTPRDGVGFAVRFLGSDEPELQVEAVAALSHAHSAEAAKEIRDTLQQFWKRRLEPEVRAAAHTILAASRHRDDYPPLPTNRPRS